MFIKGLVDIVAWGQHAARRTPRPRRSRSGDWKADQEVRTLLRGDLGCVCGVCVAPTRTLRRDDTAGPSAGVVACQTRCRCVVRPTSWPAQVTFTGVSEQGRVW